MRWRRRRDLAGRRIAVALKGGLGNQLYQWALGRALADRGADVVHHTGLLRPGFPVVIDPLVRPEALVDDDLDRWRRMTQERFAYDAEVLRDVADGTLLDGHWSSEQCFATVARSVRARVREWGEGALTAPGVELLRTIETDPGSCAVHVRRGDYVSNPNAAAHHGNLDADYYRRAMDRARSLGARRFYAFSDDLDWVIANLGDELVPVGRENGTAAVADLRLIAACRDRVVANSTFSWWGAWLAGARGSTVAPSEWFAGARRDLTDYVPAAWERVASFQDVVGAVEVADDGRREPS